MATRHHRSCIFLVFFAALRTALGVSNSGGELSIWCWIYLIFAGIYGNPAPHFAESLYRAPRYPTCNMAGLCMHIAVVLMVLAAVQGVSSPLKCKMTARVYKKTIEDLDIYVNLTKALPGHIPGAEPRYYIHQPGTCVHGTVIVVHGFGNSANDTTTMSRFLFRKGFNVIAVNQAGGGRTMEHIPGTLMRESAGYTPVRAELLSNPETKDFLAESKVLTSVLDQFLLIAQFNGTLVQRLENALNATQYHEARAALRVIKSGLDQHNATKLLRRYFETEHARHDAAAYAVTQLGDSLPGPRFMVGFSLGGAYTTYAASRSADIERAVLLAPYYAAKRSRIQTDFFTFAAYAGALDLLQQPSTALSALIIAGRLAARDVITRRVREATDVLCVMAGDDIIIDVDWSLEVCNSKLAARSFVYPKDFGINHQITPEAGNPYGEALMGQIASFLLTGTTNNTAFLVPDTPTTR